MANINFLSEEYFASYAREIKSKFQRIRELTPHPDASGDYHEEILRQLLRNFLTDRFSVKTGFVYKDKEHVSKQVDILVIDESAPATYLFKGEQFVVVTPESVVAAIEVKTHLGEQEFSDSINNLCSIKKLPDFPNSITTLVFGYKGTTATDTVLNNWFKNISLSDNRLAPDVFMFFEASRLVLKWDSSFKDSDKFRTFNLEERGDANLGWQLSVCIAAVVSGCESRDARMRGRFVEDSVANRLMQAEQSEISDHSYVFNVGHMTDS